MDLNIQEGLLTPWQQTNFQWLLGQEGLDPTAEGRIPGAFRQDWREEQWGDVYNEDTGRWTRAEDPQVRANAVAEQLRRYNAGEFNPTVGSVAGDRWTGPGVGVASADQWLPPGWTPPGGPGAGPGVGGGAYTPMAAQDWSGIMPQGVFAGSEVQPTQAMQGLVADQGLQYQPWAMPDNSVAGSPFVSQNVQYNAPLNYNPVVAAGGGDGTTTDNNVTTTQLQDWQNPQFNARTGEWMPQGFASNMDWYNSLLTPAEQFQGFQNLAKTGSTGLDTQQNIFTNPLTTLDLYNNPGFTANIDPEETFLGYE